MQNVVLINILDNTAWDNIARMSMGKEFYNDTGRKRDLLMIRIRNECTMNADRKGMYK